MKRTRRCCEIQSIFGRNLKECVLFISIACIVLSLIMLASAISSVIMVARSDISVMRNSPIVAVNMMFGLVTISISCYQIIISALLLWQSLMPQGSEFLCTLWYVSHLTIVTLYFLLFGAKAGVCFHQDRHLSAIMTAIAGVCYEGVYVYFCMIVNSYIYVIA